VLTRGAFGAAQRACAARRAAFSARPAVRARAGSSNSCGMDRQSEKSAHSTRNRKSNVVGALWNRIGGDHRRFRRDGCATKSSELLDWLALDFRDHDWDVKRFYKQLVMSATYRQAARATPEQIERDPKNRLLAHGPRFRMDGEMLRDTALATSGLLVEKIGGPSVKPYQPAECGKRAATKTATRKATCRITELRSIVAASTPSGSAWRRCRIWMRLTISFYSSIHEQVRSVVGEHGFLVALYDEKTNSINVPYLFEDGRFSSIEAFLWERALPQY